MKSLRLLLVLGCLFNSYWGLAQADFITTGSRQYDVINRFQILLAKDSVLNFSSIKPYDRRIVTERLEYVQQLAKEGKITLSKADEYNLKVLLQENFEWRSDIKDTVLGFRDIFSSKIKNHTPHIGIKRSDFSIYLTPLYTYTIGSDANISRNVFTNTRGFYIRGMLGKKIGFYTYFRTHQERTPLFVQQYINQFSAVPGAGYFKRYHTDGYDFFDGRGGIMFKATKGIDVQFAYDRVFVGDGFRSLILSDFSQNFLFLKVNARFWKFNYYNLFGEMTSAFKLTGQDNLRPKKYMAMHHLDFQVSKRINIAFYENIMFSRRDGFELNYLNPVILYQTIQQQLGSPDKLTLGFNIKANVFKRTQLYSQIVINEFLMREVLKYKNGYWANKQALQVGAKMVDFLGVKNLDVQAEVNLIRPFVYTHTDSVTNFSHYNQPLAHPLGANLKEFIGMFRYQPTPKWTFTGRVMYIEQGLDDLDGRNWGANIFRSYNDVGGILYGYHTGDGRLAKTLNAQFMAAYELIPNVFFDAHYLYRKYTVVGGNPLNTNVLTLGFRINMSRRTFDF